jgi:hypothetical protein
MNTNARRLALSGREAAEGQDSFASSVSCDNQVRRLAVGITTSTSRYRRARRRPRQLLNSLDIFGGDLTGANDRLVEAGLVSTCRRQTENDDGPGKAGQVRYWGRKDVIKLSEIGKSLGPAAYSEAQLRAQAGPER